MNTNYKLYQGDCLEIMDNSILFMKNILKIKMTNI